MKSVSTIIVDKRFFLFKLSVNEMQLESQAFWSFLNTHIHIYHNLQVSNFPLYRPIAICNARGLSTVDDHLPEYIPDWAPIGCDAVLAEKQPQEEEEEATVRKDKHDFASLFPDFTNSNSIGLGISRGFVSWLFSLKSPT